MVNIEIGYTGWPPKNVTVDTVDFQDLLRSTVICFTVLDRASFPHYNNIQIIKVGRELFYFMSNDSFSSTCANTYQHSTSYKEISVPMTCLDCKSLLGNTKELQTQAHWQYTDHWTQYSLNLWTAEAVINRASELWKSGKSRKWQSIRNYS